MALHYQEPRSYHSEMGFPQLALLVFQQVGQSLTMNQQNDLLGEMNSKLDAIGKAIDEITLSGFRSAFRAIRDGLATSNPETRRTCFDLAERNLRNLLEIERREFAGHPAETVLAWSHFALAFITYFRNDMDASTKHILEAYRESPRLSRQDLMPKVYESIFAPEIRELIERYKKMLAEKEAATREWHGKYDEENNKLQGISAHFAKAYKNTVYGDVGPALVKARQEIENEKEDAIDSYCQSRAKELLQSHFQL